MALGETRGAARGGGAKVGGYWEAWGWFWGRWLLAVGERLVDSASGGLGDVRTGAHNSPRVLAQLVWDLVELSV